MLLFTVSKSKSFFEVCFVNPKIFMIPRPIPDAGDVTLISKVTNDILTIVKTTLLICNTIEGLRITKLKQTLNIKYNI